MTYRTLSLLFIPVLVFAFALVPSAHAADLTVKVESVTMVPLPPTCEVRATKRVIRSGGSVDIVWNSKKAVRVTGLVKGDQEWPAKGRERVSIAVLGKHEFPMTFVSEGGGVKTCSATVFVHPKKKK